MSVDEKIACADGSEEGNLPGVHTSFTSKSWIYYIKNKLLCQLFRLFTIWYTLDIINLFSGDFYEGILGDKMMG